MDNKAAAKMIMRMDKKITQANAENYAMSLNMKFKNANEGIFKAKQVMKKYGLSFESALKAVIDPKQLEMLRTMNKKVS